VIGAIALTFARQRARSPMRLILSAAVFGFGVLSVLFTGSLGALDKGAMGAFGFIMAAGLIGQEVSSGVLTLAFARPLRRADWVLGRWLGASALATALVVLQVLLGGAISLARHGDPSLSLVAQKLLEGGLAATGASAVLLMFSALVPGLGDLGLVLLSTLMSSVMGMIGNHYQIGWLSRASLEIGNALRASLDLAPFFGQGSISWFDVVSYFSTIAICLVVAIHAINRKELSYASG
jgi:ABC-type transport system involved in multi-copper enzyme maturation permease subunit